MEKPEKNARQRLRAAQTGPRTAQEANKNQEYTFKSCKKKYGSDSINYLGASQHLSSGRLSDFHSTYWPQGQRLIAAFSDPAVCGFPVYPMDSFTPVSMYPLVQVSPHLQQRIPYKKIPTPVRKVRRGSKVSETGQQTDEFASLPPVNSPEYDESEHQRRFSDPGVANGIEESDDSCDSQSGSCESITSPLRLAGQLGHLWQANKDLNKELHEAKMDIHTLTSELAKCKQLLAGYEPGMIADFVRDVQDSNKVREELLFSRTRLMIEQAIARDSDCRLSTALERQKDCSHATDGLTERLTQLEEQMKTLLHQRSATICEENRDGTEVAALEQDKLQLRRELQEALDGRKAAEALAAKLELVLGVLRKKLPNGVVLEEKSSGSYLQHKTSETTAVDSLSSHSSSSTSSLVTMTGPVTDL